jgi:hypothetical protein
MEAYMKKTLLFVLLALFTGLMAFGSQSVNGPGIQGFTAYEQGTQFLPSAAAVEGTVVASGLIRVSPVISSVNLMNAVTGSVFDMRVVVADGAVKSIKGYGTFECTIQPYSGIWKGGVLSFDGGMKPGM